MKLITTILALVLVTAVVCQSQTAGDWTFSSKKLIHGMPFVKMTITTADTARDTALYLHDINADLGGRTLTYGMTINDSLNTLTRLLVLSYSPDSVAWVPIDSLSVTLQLEGTYQKNVDLTLYRYPYWRLRLGAGALADSLRGLVVQDGDFNMWYLTNLQERF